MDTQNVAAAPVATTVTRLVDYRPPVWRVRHVALRFELGIDATLVHSRLTLDGDTDAPVFLDGEDLELVAAHLDGRALTPGDYTLDAAGLTLRGARDGSVVEIDARIDPSANSQLSGLYLSGTHEHGFLLTQCEAQGFRRITFFPDRPDVLARYDVTLVADRARFPVLLAGGEQVEAGELDDGRHFARFVDPHPKPSYLFALVAGHLEQIERAYRTADGRDVTLRVWAEADAIGRCGYAMDALERAMRWDERTYGRNYDLPVFNVVATHDFNMGAMENKGLNIFNSKYLLADPDTTTDDEYRRIEAVIGHEYFHNWSGNRVTCRDWFQLSLKEGFTVFREHSFCEDLHSAALKRIEDVRVLRQVQFAEDAGPLAHPVRPAEYKAVDNFYTATVYEKGAELIRMLRGKLGAEGFRRGTDLYFSRFDGQAVTIDDLLAVLGEANGVDLSPYLAWYSQAGTPEVTATDEFDAVEHRYTLTLSQRIPATSGQADKQPVPIPVNVALYVHDGKPVPLRLTGDTTPPTLERTVELTEREQQFVFEDVPSLPTPSFCRGLSAPVRIKYDYMAVQLSLLTLEETQGYDRWNAVQQLAMRGYDDVLEGKARRRSADTWLDTVVQLFRDGEHEDLALLAELSRPPGELELGARHTPWNPAAVHAAREELENALAGKLGSALETAYQELHTGETGALDAPAAARRRLKSRMLGLLIRFDPERGGALALTQCREARGMTDRLAALSVLAHFGAPQATEALRLYRERFDGDALALDKWFSLQATVPSTATVERVGTLTSDPAFSIANPNRVHALLGAFARINPVAFHRPDGAGHRWFADQLSTIDARNPQLAARLAKAFEGWTRLEDGPRTSAESVLQKLLSRGSHSADLDEVLARMLAARTGEP